MLPAFKLTLTPRHRVDLASSGCLTDGLSSTTRPPSPSLPGLESLTLENHSSHSVTPKYASTLQEIHHSHIGFFSTSQSTQHVSERVRVRLTGRRRQQGFLRCRRRGGVTLGQNWMCRNVLRDEKTAKQRPIKQTRKETDSHQTRASYSCSLGVWSERKIVQ